MQQQSHMVNLAKIFSHKKICWLTVVRLRSSYIVMYTDNCIKWNLHKFEKKKYIFKKNSNKCLSEFIMHKSNLHSLEFATDLCSYCNIYVNSQEYCTCMCAIFIRSTVPLTVVWIINFSHNSFLCLTNYSNIFSSKLKLC